MYFHVFCPKSVQDLLILKAPNFAKTIVFPNFPFYSKHTPYRQQPLIIPNETATDLVSSQLFNEH
jgi:hypothetical protein